MRPEFLEAVCHREHVVLGRKLKPFCPWHIVLLESLSNAIYRAYMGEDVEIHPRDLLEAVEACRLSYPDVPTEVRVGLIDVARMSRGGFGKGLDAFHDYLSDHCSPPEWKVIQEVNRDAPPVGDTEPPPRPIAMVIRATKAGISYREAWGMSIGEHQWIEPTLLYLSGERVDFITDSERRFREDFLRAQADGTLNSSKNGRRKQRTRVAKERSGEAGAD